MEQTEVRLKVTLSLDRKWTKNFDGNRAELLEYLKARLNSSLGFRGQVKKLTIVDR